MSSGRRGIRIRRRRRTNLRMNFSAESIMPTSGSKRGRRDGKRIGDGFTFTSVFPTKSMKHGRITFPMCRDPSFFGSGTDMNSACGLSTSTVTASTRWIRTTIFTAIFLMPSKGRNSEWSKRTNSAGNLWTLRWSTTAPRQNW